METFVRFRRFQESRTCIYNRSMPRHALRVLLILALILLAILVPFLVSGYSEIHQASAASSYAETARHYRNAAGRIPWRADLYELAGHAYYHDKEYAQADDAYQKAFSRHALSPEGWVAWGDVNYLENNTARATEIWEQALGQKDPAPGLYSRLAQVFQANGDPRKASQYLQTYVSAHPEDASAHYRLGLLLTLSDPPHASSELKSAAQLDPQFGPAVETLRSTLNLISPDDSASRRLVIVGRGLGLVNEWQLAHAAFESAVEADKNNAEAWAWLGESNQQTGSAQDGSTELDQALKLDADSPTVRGLRGLHFQRVGNFRQALTEFEAAATLEPKNPAWFVSIGESQAKLGDLIKALNAYQTATLLAPKDPSYWRLLAIFCGEYNVNVKDIGVPAALQAVVLAKEDVASLDVLGWLLTLDSRYDEAKRMLTRAVELDPQNASVQLHLGMLFLQTSDRASAYDHLVRSRDLGNKDAEAVLKQYFP